MKATVARYFILTLFATIYFHIFTRVLWRVGDEGSIVYGAALVAKGAIPYKDFFEVMGPMTFFWLGLFFKFFGTNLVVARGLLLVTGVMIILTIFFITRKYYKGSFDYIPAVLYMILSIPLWPANNHHWDSNLFALLSIILFTRWWDKGDYYSIILAGFLAGITTCFMQNKGLFLFIIFLILLIIEALIKEQKRHKSITRYGALIAGYSIVGISAVFFFYSNDALSELVYANLIWPLTQYNNVNDLPFGYGIREWFLPSWKTIPNAVLPSSISILVIQIFIMLFYMVMVIPIIILIAFISEKITANKRLFNYSTLPLVLCGIALWLSELHRKDIIHIIYGSPILIIIFFLIIVKQLENKKIIRDSLLVAVSIFIIFFGTYNGFVSLNAKTLMTTRKGEIYTFKEDSCLKFLNENTEPGDYVFVYPYYPMYYFLADVRNPTRYSILMYNINTGLQFTEVINDLDKKKVKYVLWDTEVNGHGLAKWFPEYKHPSEKSQVIENYIKKKYRSVAVKNGFRILQRKS